MFAVLSQGDDYARIDELVKIVNNHNEEAIEKGGIVIAMGMARYEHDDKPVEIDQLIRTLGELIYDAEEKMTGR